MTCEQPELSFAVPRHGVADAELLASMLYWLRQTDDWITARDLCRFLGIPATDNNKRRLRDCAQNSEGAIAGGQKGYKLVETMTVAEYNHFRNWMSHQAEAMTRRILQSDKHFYSRKPIP
jgi:hypothetical protein